MRKDPAALIPAAVATPAAVAGAPGPSAADASVGGGLSQQLDDTNAINTSNSSASGGSCCSAVYAHRAADFKRHPTAAACRQQRIELNASLRSQTRGDLLRQLREEAERQLLEEQELLQQQVQHADQKSKRPSGYRRSGHYVKAPEECMESRRLRQLLAHPQHIIETPEELQSGEFMVALRPEGRSSLLLLRNGKGHLYDKKERVLFRVQSTSNQRIATTAAAAAAAACSDSCFYGRHLKQPDKQYRLPMQPEEMQQLQDDETFFLPPEEKQRLLLQRARAFGVSLYAFQEADAHPDEPPLSSAQVPGESCGATSAPQKTEPSLKQQQRQQRRGSKQQQRQKEPPLLCLPEGILSKGLTLLECVLCPYTPANIQYFSRQYGQQEDDAVAAAAAAATASKGTGQRWNSKEEQAMYEVLFIVDVLFLGGLMLGHCEFECRHFFLKSRIEESPESFAPLQLLPFIEASASHLSLLSSGPFVYPPDGFVFHHKLAPHVGGPNPFVLCWRDKRIARFLIDEKNVGQPHIDTFLLFNAEGQVYSDEGICVAEVSPEEFGIAGLPEPRVMHCWIADLDMKTGRFLTVKKPPQEGHDVYRGEQMSTEPYLSSLPTSARHPATNPQGEECLYEGTEETIGIDMKEEGPTPMETCGRQQLRGGGPRRYQIRQQRDRAAESHSKLVDQWLRMKGSHPVNMTVLSNNCPP